MRSDGLCCGDGGTGDVKGMVNGGVNGFCNCCRYQCGS